MGVDEDMAVRDGGQMEHVDSDESFSALKKYFLQSGVSMPEEEPHKALAKGMQTCNDRLNMGA